MEICYGIIVTPFVVSREEFKYETIRVIKRDGYHITLIKFCGMWFILQTCRKAYLENDHSWYIMHKEYTI
jgi:hypothetical protein